MSAPQLVAVDINSPAPTVTRLADARNERALELRARQTVYRKYIRVADDAAERFNHNASDENAIWWAANIERLARIRTDWGIA